MIKQRRGFTLIELLVVIAIIAILAAMLFPVFARARESARKIQCLSNVKNIAMALQIYLSDYDRFPPNATDAAAISYFETQPGGGEPYTNMSCAESGRIYNANPFLRVPTILDEYIKNRDVWTCPSARTDSGAKFILPGYHAGGWLGYLKATEGQWGASARDGSEFGPCKGSWPAGWGGAVTDSLVQRENAREGIGSAVSGAFGQSIGTNINLGNAGMNLSRIDDPSWYVVVADTGLGLGAEAFSPQGVAYPDVCGAGCSVCGGYGDWTNCSWSVQCSVGTGTDWATNVNTRKQNTRHLGGTNVGFADGHASWFSSEYLFAEAPHYGCGCWGNFRVVEDGKFKGLVPNMPTSAAGSPADGVAKGAVPSLACGIPVLY